MKTDSKGLNTKALQKLDKGSSIAKQSNVAPSQNSRGTRNTFGTRSRKSKNEDDFENMEPEEIQTRIEAEEVLMNKLIKEKNRIEKKKVATDNQKKKELEPIE